MSITRPTRTRRRLAAASAVLAGVTLALPAALRADGGAAHAGGVIVDTGGNEIGFVRIVEDGAGGVHVNVKVRGLTPGLHGTHLHAVGTCTPTFAAAGSHHNPLGATHGDHAGDLPNLVVNEARRGSLNAHLDGFSLTPGPTALLDTDGAALIIHAGVDDLVTDPTGNSGGRVACAVISAD